MELHQGEIFFIEVIRCFDFLIKLGYYGSGFNIAGREFFVKFTNIRLYRSITIVLEESQELNMIFETKTFLGKSIKSMKEISYLKRCPTSVRTLAELAQSDYLYLIKS